MNENENIYLQGLNLSINALSVEIAKQRQEAAERGRYDGLPEWIDLEQAVGIKRGLCANKKHAENDFIIGGASLNTYRQKLFLQPCCGLNYKLVGGRRCWKKDDVIAWLAITDEDLSDYAEKHRAELPDIYKRRKRTA